MPPPRALKDLLKSAARCAPVMQESSNFELIIRYNLRRKVFPNEALRRIAENSTRVVPSDKTAIGSSMGSSGIDYYAFII